MVSIDLYLFILINTLSFKKCEFEVRGLVLLVSGAIFLQCMADYSIKSSINYYEHFWANCNCFT